MERKECVLCNGNLEIIHTVKELPIFMGVVKDNTNFIKKDLVLSKCLSCGIIQNKHLLDLDKVYMNNHNTDIVGDIWNNHYKEFSVFINKNSIGNSILEIGDPSAKVAKILHKKYDKWVIVEPNPTIDSFDNVEIIKGFFDVKYINNDINTIIHSHVLEHIYKPIDFLKEAFTFLKDDGCVIFSIPNMKWLLNNKSLPTSILNFEHTYYIDIDNVECFVNKAGFRLETVYEYKNHSLFVKCVKDKIKYDVVKYDISNLFLKNIDFINDKIKEIKLIKDKFYLYSAHINSQYILSNGIDNIISLLDSSPSKIGKKLYGYDYDINNPNIIEKVDKPIVVVSHMGVYTDEISNNLIKINNSVILK